MKCYNIKDNHGYSIKINESRNNKVKVWSIG